MHEVARDIRVALSYLKISNKKLSEVHLRLAALDRHVSPILNSVQI